MRRSRTVFEARSHHSGRVRVVEDARERRLIVGGDILSVYPLNDDWARVRREYWWHALVALPLPARPRALFVGLGGGTQVHLLRALARPRSITVIERDPAILRAADAWFGLAAIDGVEYLCGDVDRVAPALARAGRRFDFVMEDVAYGAEPARGLALARGLVPLVAGRGVLVLNRHRRRDARRLVEELGRWFEVRLRRVRREAENVLVCCVRSRGQAAGRRL